MKRNALFLFSVLPLCLLLSIPALALESPGVVLFSPQRTVKKVRQVAARFSEPMVPFGDPRLSDPFEISCPVKGKGRWADDRNWAYDFEEDLPAGIRCEFMLKPGLTTLSGKVVAGEQKFSFSTGGPAILFSTPREGTIHVDEEQIFLLLLDAEADGESILANASFSVEGIEERVGVAFAKEEERKKLLDSIPEQVFVSLCREIFGKKTTLEFRKRKDLYDDPRIVFLRAKQRFPAETKVNLVWGKGIRSRTGFATDEPQVLHFRTRGPFTATFRCPRENPNAACIPLLPMSLHFSASISRELAEKIALKGPGEKMYKPSLGRDGEEVEFVFSVEFKGAFPENTTFSLVLPENVQDDAGRLLANAGKFPLAVATDAFPPLAKFSAPFGIIELSDPVLPVTLRNLEAQVRTRMLEVDENGKDTIDRIKEGSLDKTIRIGKAIQSILPDSMKEKGENVISGLQGRLQEIQTDREEKIAEWLRKVMRSQRYPWPSRRESLLAGASGTRTFSVPKPNGEKAFEVVGIPLPKAGFYVVEMESRILGSALLGAEEPMYVPAAALVTNLAAHFKWGRESSIVWVTTLDKGEPVEDARVIVRNSSGNVLWQGNTDANGIAWIRQELPPEKYQEKCDPLCGHFITARKGEDLTFVFSDWDTGIEPWRFQLPTGDNHDPTIAHTVFDRTLFRAGETVQMKHFIRRHSMQGLFFVREEKLPKAVLIEHKGSEQRYELPLKWGPGGNAETTWKIPPDAKLGEYGVAYLAKETGKTVQRTEVGRYRAGDEEYYSAKRWPSGSFRVEEYRVPLMKGSIQAPGGPFVRVKEMDLDLLVSYLSGGGAGEAPVKLRTDIQTRHVGFPDYGEFVFSNGKVKEGVTRGATAVYEEEGGEEDEATEGAAQPREAGKKRAMQVRDLVLDRYGALRTKVKGLPLSTIPKDLVAELEYRDPNGETQTVSARIPIWPARLLVGIKPDSWAASKNAFKFHVAVLDIKGKPAANIPVTVDLFQRKHYSHRTRLVGGFYSYENVTEVKRLGGTLCKGTTDAMGLLICETEAPVSGNVILQATAKDKQGNESVANRDVWVAGRDEWWFEVADSDRIDLLPERKRYEPGETAKFQVRMPFREATALVTVEREGIVDVFLKALSGKKPVIEVPVKNYHAPNVFVSALCVRGRVAGSPPTAMVDLGKPAYKLGIAEINVGWKVHELKVGVAPEKDVYKIREKVRVKIRVGKAVGGPPPTGTEAAVAAVDEGLLELTPNESWQLLRAMMGRRPYEVRTSTAQMQVTGKRHFGLKAIPSGGGGGKQATRKFFDTLLYWNARVPLDNNGEAEVEIPLNDSLTSFRIVAVASAGAEFFGTGEASIRTTQDLILISGLPPLVREGDRFRAGFTARNSTDHPMEVRVTANASGAKELSPHVQSLAPGEAKEVGWDIRVPVGVDTLDWEVTAKTEGNGTGDRIKVKQKVAAAVPVRTFQATITQLAEPVAMELEKPADAVPGKGGIDVSFRAKLSEGMGGVKYFMKEYPYTCLEQKISRAVALRDAAMWKEIMEGLPSYLDGDGLVKYFPSMIRGSDALTAYLLSIADETGYEISAPLKNRMEDALTGFIQGRIVRHGFLPTADLSIRKIAALEALSRSGKSSPSLLGSITLEPNLWPTSAVLDWANVLLRTPTIPDREKRLNEAEQILRSRLNFQGTTMGFSTERTDYLWWLMVSGDVNAVKGVLTFLRMKGWEPDMPRIVNGAIGRQYRGAWNTTIANAWGVLAMEEFSEKYESAPVSGTTQAALAGSARSVDWGKSPSGEIVSLGWPKGKGTLSLSHRGTGKPWATIRSLAAIPLKEPFSSGYRIAKTVTPVVQRNQGTWGRGDVARVTLTIDAQADMTWVVVSDPVPAGASILGTGLGRDSQLLARGEKREGLAWPAFEERAFDSFRAYYEFVPKGKWTVEYTVRLNNEGSFLLPATRVEALYAPEMFGEFPNPAFEVRP